MSAVTNDTRPPSKIKEFRHEENLQDDKTTGERRRRQRTCQLRWMKYMYLPMRNRIH